MNKKIHKILFIQGIFFAFSDYLDIVKDNISAGDYRKEEDPTIFVSEKTGRGPLEENWREDYGRICADPLTRGPHRVMCAYKLCKVEFRYWGMQSKIERFIHDVGKSDIVTQFLWICLMQ